MFIRIILNYWQTNFCEFEWFRWVLDTLLKVPLILLTLAKVLFLD